MRIKCLFLFLFLIADILLCSESGGLPGEFLRNASGARSFGLGRAFSAISDDASSVYHNPAGLNQLEKKEIMVSHAPLFEETKYDFFSFVSPTKNGGFGVAIINLNSSNFRKTTIENQDIGVANLNECSISVSFARVIKLPFLNKRLLFGTTLKEVYQIVDVYSDFSFGVDIGFLYEEAERLKFALVIQNILQPRIKLKEQTDVFPVSFRIGSLFNIVENKLNFSADIEKVAGRQLKLYFGAEFNFLENVVLRGGINEQEISLGFSFKFSPLRMDYGCGYNGYLHTNQNTSLGILHRFSFVYFW